MIATRWFTEAIHAYVKGILVAWCSIDHLFRQRITLIAVRFAVQFTTFMRQYLGVPFNVPRQILYVQIVVIEI